MKIENIVAFDTHSFNIIMFISVKVRKNRTVVQNLSKLAKFISINMNIPIHVYSENNLSLTRHVKLLIVEKMFLKKKIHVAYFVFSNVTFIKNECLAKYRNDFTKYMIEILNYNFSLPINE